VPPLALPVNVTTWPTPGFEGEKEKEEVRVAAGIGRRDTSLPEDPGTASRRITRKRNTVRGFSDTEPVLNT